MNTALPARPRPESLAAQSTRLDLVGLMLAALVLYTVNVDFTLYGDAGMYADYVVLRKFDEVTLHLGYYLLVFLGDKVLGGLFGIPIPETEVWLNVVAGTLSVGVAYLLARELFGARREALLCAMIFGLSGRVFNNATSSEMYMVQTLCVLTSFYLFVRERIVLSGIVCGMALLVSPLSAFAYLFYPVYDFQRSGTIRWAVLFRLAAAGLLVYLPYLIVDGHELLFGVRGLLTIHKLVRFDPLASLAHFPTYQFKAFTVLSVLLIPAVMAWRANRRVFILALAVGIPHLYIILKLTGEDHVFILNSDFFYACCLVIGWRQMQTWKIGRVVAPLLLVAHVGLYVASGIIHTFQPHRDYADELRRVARTYLTGRNSIIVTDWGRAVALTFYGRPKPTTTVLMDSLFQHQIYDVEGEPLQPITYLDRPEVYLLDAWTPSPLNHLLRSQAALENFRQQNSILGIARREFKLDCSLIEVTTHRIYRCVRRKA